MYKYTIVFPNLIKNLKNKYLKITKITMATNETIANYNSDSEEDDTISTIVNSKRKSKRERNWALEKVFSNSKDSLEFIDLENTWSLHDKNETVKR